MRSKQKIINLYEDNTIYSIKHVVSIGNEEDLNQFWCYFDQEMNHEHQLFYHFMDLMYAFASDVFSKNKEIFFELIVEQSERYFYLTLWNINISQLFKQFLDKRGAKLRYKIDKKRICVQLDKVQLQMHDQDYKAGQKNREKSLVLSLENKKSLHYPVYDFLEEDDKQEVLKMCEDMSDVMYLGKQRGFDNNAFITIRSCLSMFTLNLLPYTQLSNITNTVTEFSVLMNTYRLEFIALSLEEISLVEGFLHNLERWANTLFVEGGADLHFMDNSLRADMQMIKMLIEPPVHEVVDMEGIFSF